MLFISRELLCWTKRKLCGRLPPLTNHHIPEKCMSVTSLFMPKLCTDISMKVSGRSGEEEKHKKCKNVCQSTTVMNLNAKENSKGKQKVASFKGSFVIVSLRFTNLTSWKYTPKSRLVTSISNKDYRKRYFLLSQSIISTYDANSNIRAKSQSLFSKSIGFVDKVSWDIRPGNIEKKLDAWKDDPRHSGVKNRRNFFPEFNSLLFVLLSFCRSTRYLLPQEHCYRRHICRCSPIFISYYSQRKTGHKVEEEFEFEEEEKCTFSREKGLKGGLEKKMQTMPWI